MDLLDQLDEQKYPESLNVAEIRSERVGKWERMFDKYKERSKKRQYSISLDEFDINYPNTNRELVENPHTKTFRKFLRQQGDLIDELTTVAGDPASDEEELGLSESESEDECEDFSNVIGYYDCIKLDEGKIEANDDKKGEDSENNIGYDKIEFREDRVNTENETKHPSFSNILSDDADNDDFIYSAGNPEYSNSVKLTPRILPPSNDNSSSNPKPEKSILNMTDTIETSGSEKRSQTATREDISKNTANNFDNKDESLENDTKPFVSKYFCKMKCIECGQEVTTVLHMEESSSFKCDDCWLDYDHGCDVDKDCEECRELALWLHTRWDVWRRISQGELDGDGKNETSVPTDLIKGELDGGGTNETSVSADVIEGELDGGGTNETSVPTDGIEGELEGGGTNEKSATTDKSDGELDDATTNENSVSTDNLERLLDDGGIIEKSVVTGELADGGTNDRKSALTDGSDQDNREECLTCTECGAATEVPEVVEDSSRFKCDDCLLGYQHGCDMSQYCQQCRDIIVWVQARREVVNKLKGGFDQIESLEDSLESLVLDDAEEDATTESTAEESEDEQSVHSDLSDEIVESVTGTTLGESEIEDEVMMDTTEPVSNDISNDITDTVPEKNKTSKNKMTRTQLNILIPFFEEYPRPTTDQKLSLAHQTGLTKQVLQRWFDNRRRPKLPISK